MYPKAVIFFIAAFFAVFVTANNPVTVTVTATAPASTVTTLSQCNTGTTSCCNSVQSSSDDAVSSLLGLLGIVLGDVTGLIGLGCTPISILGIGGGASCNQQAVCCTDVAFSGLVSFSNPKCDVAFLDKGSNKH